MRPVASVLLDLATRDGARATLDALWSEVPAVPVEVLVHARGPALDVARREHARRATVVAVSEPDRPPGAGRALLTLALASRARLLLVLAEGARPTAGWARELAAVAHGEVAGLELAPGLACPRVVAPGALAGPQSPPEADLAPFGEALSPRQVADRVRFDDLRVDRLAHAEASAACLAIPRAVLARVGLPDPRLTSTGGALLDLQRRARAAGLPLRLARRALVAAPGPLPPSPADRALLAERAGAQAALHAGAGAAGPEGLPRVALELEPDDPAAPALAEVAAALCVVGVPLLTWSTRAWPGRPTPAPHVTARAPDSAAAASDLLLLRRAPPCDAPALRLLLGDEAEPAGDELAALRLDLGLTPEGWAAAVRAAARGGP